jgi:hypothetical protein
MFLDRLRMGRGENEWPKMSSLPILPEPRNATQRTGV